MRIDPNPLSRTLQGLTQLVLLFQQPRVSCALLVVHFGASAGQSFGVILFGDRASDRRPLALADTVFGKSLRDAIFDHLTDGSEFITDCLGLSYERLQNDVRFALLIAEIPAIDLLRRLELPIDSAIALFQPGGIPRQIEMNEV